MIVEFETKFGKAAIDVPDTRLTPNEIVQLPALKDVMQVYGAIAFRDAVYAVIRAKSIFIPA